MMQSLGGDDDLPEETEEERLRRRVTELEGRVDRLNENLTWHVNSYNNPHNTRWDATGAVSRGEMRNLYEDQINYHDRTANTLIGVMLFLMLFFVLAVIHYCTQPVRDWVIVTACIAGAVVPYWLLSRQVDHHRYLVAKYRALSASIRC